MKTLEDNLKISLKMASARSLRDSIQEVVDEFDSIINRLTNNRVRVILKDEFEEEDVRYVICLDGKDINDVKHVIPFFKCPIGATEAKDFRVSDGPKSIDDIKYGLQAIVCDPDSKLVRALEWFMRDMS